MEWGFEEILKLLLIILIAVAILAAIYFLKDALYEKTSTVKDIFSNLS